VSSGTTFHAQDSNFFFSVHYAKRTSVQDILLSQQLYTDYHPLGRERTQRITQCTQKHI
jgi:hypothetical protein